MVDFKSGFNESAESDVLESCCISREEWLFLEQNDLFFRKI